jgi:hypothetical protein
MHLLGSQQNCKAKTTNMKLFLVTVAYLLSPNLAHGNSIRGLPSPSDVQNSVLCRMLILGTLFESEANSGFMTTEESACAPIVNGREVDTLIPLRLPEDIEASYKQELHEGTLLVEISDAGFELGQGSIALSVSSTFSVIEEMPAGLRHLQEQRKLAATEQMTLAVVRIISKDGKAPTATAADFETMMSPNLVNLSTQFQKCSIGQFGFKKATRFVIDVVVDQPMSFYTTGAQIVEAASQKFVAGGTVTSMDQLANRVIFCVPPGTGTWAANAGMNHWRAQFNDPFCMSLSATMHELGHTIGLPHSNAKGIKYGDATGYMARSYRNSNWPQRCYNGRNSDFLGWYASKTVRLSGTESPKLYDLGNIVDYAKSTTILITINSTLMLMYNRAKSFNVGTGELADTVTLTESIAGGSDRLGSLIPGSGPFTYGNVVIEACKMVNDGNPDRMIVSVGKGSSICSSLGNAVNAKGIVLRSPGVPPPPARTIPRTPATGPTRPATPKQRAAPPPPAPALTKPTLYCQIFPFLC